MCLRAVLLAVLAAGGARAQGRVIILGVDGMDAGLTREFLAAGHLPALKTLLEHGAFKPLLPTNPAQSPTSWSTLVTGRNPGVTGIFGFLRRDFQKGAVIPRLSLSRRAERPAFTKTLKALTLLSLGLLALVPLILLRRRVRLALVLTLLLLAGLLLPALWLFAQVPASLPAIKNLRDGEAFWSAFDHLGIPGTYLGAPCAFPAPPLQHGKLLCGLGVPDLLGTMGSVALFVDEPLPGGIRLTPLGGRKVALHRGRRKGLLLGAALGGPPSPLDGRRPRVPLSFQRHKDRVSVTFQGRETELVPSSFTSFLPVHYQFGAFIKVQGLVRLRLQEGTRRLAVYQEPVEFDPRHQAAFAPVTSPRGFGAKLAEGGLFETAGWAAATNPYTDGLIDDAAVVEDISGLVRTRSRQIKRLLQKRDWRVFFGMLSTPDRVQHIFWRDRDKTHPAYNAQRAAARGDKILWIYQQVDHLIGYIAQHVLKQGDRFLVVSDHGFASWRVAVNLNRWLMEAGFLVGLDDGRRTLAGGLGKPVFQNIDWRKSQAYSLGLGRIWLNLKGREPKGLVTSKQREGVLAAIQKGLLALRYKGQRVVHSVTRAGKLYRGRRTKESADLIVGFERGFRVSWDSCLGGLGEPLFALNRSRWSGDHCSVDPELVRGVLISSFSLAAGVARVEDIYPTLRALLGLAPDPLLDGHALLPVR